MTQKQPEERESLEEILQMEAPEEGSLSLDLEEEAAEGNREVILVALSESANCPKVIRAAARLAAELSAPLKAVYVEQRRIEELGEEDRRNVTENIRLAKSLGAEMLFAYGTNVVGQLTETANVTGATKLFIGISGRKLMEGKENMGIQIKNRMPSLDVYIIPGAAAEPPRGRMEVNEAVRKKTYSEKSPFILFLYLLGVMALCTVIALVGRRIGLPYVDIVIIYLFGVLLLSILDGNRIYLAAGSLFAVALADYFFVEPYYSFHGSNYKDIVTLCMMFAMSFTVSSLMGRIRQELTANHRTSMRTDILFNCSTSLLRARNKREVESTIAEQMTRLVRMSVVIYRKSGEGRLMGPFYYPKPGVSEAQLYPLDNENDRAAAETVLETGQRSGYGTKSNNGARALYLPIKNGDEIYAAVGLYQEEGEPLPPFEYGVLNSILNEAALVYERLSGGRRK